MALDSLRIRLIGAVASDLRQRTLRGASSFEAMGLASRARDFSRSAIAGPVQYRATTASGAPNL